ncbi:MAG: phosphoenolpyruvate--protein phosphotransferase [Propionibacteriaceae bacterium]|jgi:phosphotransferase system enzyme I (PtsI)|nr:phosphoenolpyruvate--protein phosphotransferase [Propionibacteriaceae bacterium]
MSEERVLDGLSAGRGIAVGPVAIVHSAPPLPEPEPTPADPQAATTAIDEAFAVVAEALTAQAAAAEGTVAEVLGATALMAADPALIGETHRLVGEGTPPAHAVHAAVAQFAEILTAAGPPLSERVTDLDSVRDRVVAHLLDVPAPGVTLSEPSIIVAVDLAPADTAALDLGLVAGIVTEQGGPTSHTAIIAGQLGIPCLVRVAGATSIPAGATVAIDAAAGRLIVAPSAETRAELERRAGADAAMAEDTAAGATSDGHPVALLANIGTAEDAERAAATAAEGVGLMRTEVQFLGRAEAPSVEEQAEAFRRVVAAFGERKVVVRTLDAGSDKPLAFAHQTEEENPALGVRGYRLCRTLPALLDGQLTALGAVAASAGESLWVMAPMVATAAETRAFVTAAHAAGIAQAGVMVEVPAAALMAAEILAEADFVSLGTNDLAQYTMAADRLSGTLADLTNLWQPAVLRLVCHVATAGITAGKPVGVCGESASDPLMALVLAGFGITSLSMSPPALPAVRFALRRHTLDQCKAMAAAAYDATSAEEARAAALALVDPAVAAQLGLG